MVVSTYLRFLSQTVYARNRSFELVSGTENHIRGPGVFCMGADIGAPGYGDTKWEFRCTGFTEFLGWDSNRLTETRIVPLFIRTRRLVIS